jgi:predicted RNase H-like HicB family nuclease
MTRQFDVLIERDEEGMYVASVPQLPGCHTDANSIDELMVEIREAIQLYLEAEGAERSKLEFIDIRRVTIAA